MLKLLDKIKRRTSDEEIEKIKTDRVGSIFDNIPRLEDIVYLTSAIELNEDKIKFGSSRYTRQYYIVAWPRTVNFMALEPIYNFNVADIDLSLHIIPAQGDLVVRQLTNEISKLEATYMKEKKDGNITNLTRLERAISDMYVLREQIETGDEKLFFVSVLVSIGAGTEEELDKICRLFEREMSGRGFIFQDAYKRQDDAFLSVMPSGVDRIGSFQNMESTAVAMLFPFTSSRFSHTTGIPLGRDMASGNPFFFNPFIANNQLFNPNGLVFAVSGAGKSFLMKMFVARALILGIHVVILDPEGEYRNLVNALGGEYVDLSLYSKNKINPCDVEAVTEEDEETGEKVSRVKLLAKIADLVRLTKFMASGGGNEHISGVEITAIEKAWKMTYEKFGITDDPESLYTAGRYVDGRLETRQKKKMPQFSDFYECLEKIEGFDSLKATLSRYKADGTMGMFDCQSTVNLNSHLIAFNLKPLESEGELLRPLAMNVVLAWAKDKFIKANTPFLKMILADEAQNFLKHQDTADFVEESYRQIRKWGGSAWAISQSYQTFEHSPQGLAMIQNAGTSILLRQQTSDIEYLKRRYNLTEGEADFLITCQKGEVLFKTMTETAFVKLEPTQLEFRLFNTTKGVV